MMHQDKDFVRKLQLEAVVRTQNRFSSKGECVSDQDMIRRLQLEVIHVYVTQNRFISRLLQIWKGRLRHYLSFSHK